MSTCIDPERGRLLPLYEDQRLDPEQVLQFEEHVLVCDHCCRELERSIDIRALFAKHGRALRQHYAETGRDFSRELAELTAAHGLKRSSRRVPSLLGSFAGWFDHSREFRIVLPTVVVASVALFLVLRNRPTPVAPHGTPDGSVTEVTPDGRAIEPPGGADPAPPSTPGTESAPAPTERTTTAGDEQAGSRVPARSAEQKEALVASLLPREPIPYTELATRGDDMVGDEKFRAAMRFYAGGQFDSCASGLRALMARSPGDETLSKYLGSSLYMTGDYAGAADALTRAMQLADAQPDARVRLYLAAALIRLSRESEARGMLSELARNPNRVIANRADSLLRALE